MIFLYRFDISPYDLLAPYLPDYWQNSSSTAQFYTSSEVPVQLTPQPVTPPVLFENAEGPNIVGVNGGYGGNPTWLPAKMKSAKVSLSNENTSPETRFEVSLDHPIAQLFLSGPPSEHIWLTVYVVPAPVRSDTAYTASPPTFWPTTGTSYQVFCGRLLNVEYAPGVATLLVMALENVLQKSGAIMKFSRQCNWNLYDSNCQQPRSPAMIANGTVATISADGLTVTLNSGWGNLATPSTPQPDQKYTGGMLAIDTSSTDTAQWLNSYAGGTYSPTLTASGCVLRTIVSHVGNVMMLKFAVPTNLTGNAAILYVGCPKTGAACRGFGNYKRFGGWEYVPIKDPFIESPFGS